MVLPTLEKTIFIQQLAPDTGPWLVAVSGGADSLALLHALLRLQTRFDYRLHVATFNHQIRVPDGADDALFVQSMSKSWGLPVTLGTGDVPALARDEHLSIEVAARLARYRFLASVARQIGATRVATAHNADDQAETVLMHLLRGAGLGGLRGMAYAAPMPAAPELLLTRPFLDIPRDVIEAYCASVGLAPRQDATNLDTTYLRNRLRRDVMPRLREINPQVGRQLRQLANAAAVDADYMETAFATSIVPAATVSEEHVSLPLSVFRAAHPALQRRYVVWAARQLVADVELSFSQQVEGVQTVLNGPVGAQTTLPDGLRLRVGYADVIVEYADRPLPVDGWQLASNSEISLSVPGVTRIGNRAIQTRVVEQAATAIPSAAMLSVPAHARVWVRCRLPGDRFAPPGLHGHTQKLKEWLINHKVPQALRDRLPLVMVDDVLAALYWEKRWVVSSFFSADVADERIRIALVLLEGVQDY